MQLDAEARAVAERLDDGVGEIVHVDRNLVETVSLEIMEKVSGVWNAGNRHERLGDEFGQWVEARREASGQNHRFH